MQIDVDGKVRNRPHMVGSWACHVLVRLSIPSTVKQHLYNHFTSHFPQAHTEPDPHISLSKTFYARHWQLNTLKDKLRQATAKVSLPENISLLAHHWTIYYNEERTRAFLALDCDETSSRILGSLVSQIDLVLRGFGFSSYYEVVARQFVRLKLLFLI